MGIGTLVRETHLHCSQFKLNVCVWGGLMGDVWYVCEKDCVSFKINCSVNCVLFISWYNYSCFQSILLLINPPVSQWSSNLSMHQSHLGGLVCTNCWVPLPSFWSSMSGWYSNFFISNKFLGGCWWCWSRGHILRTLLEIIAVGQIEISR